MANKAFISENFTVGNFAKDEDILNITSEVDFKNRKGREGGIPAFSDGRTANVYGGESSTCIVGTPGSRKTRSVVLPYLISCAIAGENVVVHDPKAELYRHSSTVLSELGYKIVVLDFRNPETGDTYNPWYLPAKLYKEGKINNAMEWLQTNAEMIFSKMEDKDDPIWTIGNAAYLKALVSTLLEFLPAEEINFRNIMALHTNEFGKDSTAKLSDYYKDRKDSINWMNLSTVLETADQTMKSFFAVFNSAMAVYVQNEAILDMTATNSFEVEDLGKSKTAVFIISKDETEGLYNTLISLIFNQIYEILIEYAEKQKEKKLKRRVNFILDEFGNMAPISNIESKLTAGRSRNIRWLVCLQSRSQLDLKYGADRAKVILESCANLVYMYSTDIDLLQYISALCGSYQDEITNEKKPLLSVEKLRRFSKAEGECLLLLERQSPFVAYLPDISEYAEVEVVDAFFEKRENSNRKAFDFKSYFLKVRENNRRNVEAGTKEESVQAVDAELEKDPYQMIPHINRIISHL